MSEAVRNEAVNDVLENQKHLEVGTLEWVKAIGAKFIQKKIEDFPRICKQFCIDEHNRRLADWRLGNEGGWSEKRTFKQEYNIPNELYLFMVNMVFKDFWDDNNRKVWKPFLDGLLKGNDPIETLMKAKSYYGSTKSMIKAGEL